MRGPLFCLALLGCGAPPSPAVVAPEPMVEPVVVESPPSETARTPEEVRAHFLRTLREMGPNTFWTEPDVRAGIDPAVLRKSGY